MFFDLEENYYRVYRTFTYEENVIEYLYLTLILIILYNFTQFMLC